MAIPIRDLLARSPDRVILMDGGMGTTCEDRGVTTHSTLWGSFSLLSPEGRKINDAIHGDFVDAGAQILTANTHYALKPFCKAFLTSPSCDEGLVAGFAGTEGGAVHGGVLHAGLIRVAIESVQKAIPAGEPIAAATCMGSFEGPYARSSTLPAAETARLIKTELEVRQAARSDLVIFETLTTLEEIEGVALAARDRGETDVAVGFTCGPDGKTLAGVSMAEAVGVLSPVAPLIWFVQCTRYDLVKRALTDLKGALGPRETVGVYANDGRNWDNRRMEWIGNRIGPEEYGAFALRWRDAGARIIGGCCGTSPEHIKRLKEIFEKAP